MAEPTDPIIDRQAARVLLLDRHNRVLLFRCQEPGADRAFWITPGGGLEADETHEQAAERELYEETGLSGVPIGPCVWTRSHTFPWLGRVYRQHERFFVAHVDQHEVIRTAHTEEERQVLRQHRWWSVRSIEEAREECFAPRRIGACLHALLGARPAKPIDVGV
ncbi:MAG: NUDIX domain-containing protein [Planctomycetota bacterium]